jgi:hypothetical protein
MVNSKKISALVCVSLFQKLSGERERIPCRRCVPVVLQTALQDPVPASRTVHGPAGSPSCPELSPQSMQLNLQVSWPDSPVVLVSVPFSHCSTLC